MPVRLKEHLEESEQDIRLYRQLVARADACGKRPVLKRFQIRKPARQRLPAIRWAKRASTANPLRSRRLRPPGNPVRAIEQLYHDRLDKLVTDDQRKLGSPPTETSRLQRVDAAVAWLLMSSACLVLGLFTRLAAVGGCCFLLSVICTQPPWLPGAIITYNQTVELTALLMLITTPVGRWGGLDFFIHRVCFGSSCQASGPPAEKQA